MGYTKGKWIVRRHGITSQILVETPTNRPDAEKYQVAEGIYNKANAQLIAAAPAMYEALKSVIKTSKYCQAEAEHFIEVADSLNNAIKAIAEVGKC